MEDCEFGIPFAGDPADPIDDWSRAVFEACRGWPLAGTGRWYRLDDGWIRLRIDQVDGEPLEPLFAIELETWDGQVNLDFGSWCTPISPPAGRLREAADQAVASARDLVEGWLADAVRIASYSDETGWRGSKIVGGRDLPADLEPVPVALGDQGRVIVKTPRRSGWRSWRRVGDDLWIECEIDEG